MRSRAFPGALAVLLCCGSRAMAQEPPRAELLKLLDRVIADPSDAAARSDLGDAAYRGFVAEKRAAAAERDAIMKAADKAKAGREWLDAAKARRLAAWREGFEDACSLASAAETVAAAVESYGGLLEKFPVYSGTERLLEDSSKKIMAVFFRTIKKYYPHLVTGYTTADPRLLAALIFYKTAEHNSMHGGLIPTGGAEVQLKRAEKLAGLEAEIRRRHASLSAGMDLFWRRSWAEAVKSFDEVISFDAGNEEALYYRGLAAEKAAPGTTVR